jgi:hypothetical protein
MNVKVLEVKTKDELDSKIEIVRKGDTTLPSITDGWRFNFRKHSKSIGYETYVLVKQLTPNIIEGCLIVHHKDEGQSYMAYVELAPHNRDSDRKHDWVAGCLIAFACRLSFIKGKEGYLALDVIEEKKEDEIKLMKVYSDKYYAVRLEKSTTMIILPEGSEKLINEYLIRQES